MIRQFNIEDQRIVFERLEQVTSGVSRLCLPELLRLRVSGKVDNRYRAQAIKLSNDINSVGILALQDDIDQGNGGRKGASRFQGFICVRAMAVTMWSFFSSVLCKQLALVKSRKRKADCSLFANLKKTASQRAKASDRR